MIKNKHPHKIQKKEEKTGIGFILQNKMPNISALLSP